MSRTTYQKISLRTSTLAELSPYEGYQCLNQLPRKVIMGKKSQICHWDEILFKMSTILPMWRFWLFLIIFGSFMAFYRNMSLEALKKFFYVKIGYILYIKKFQTNILIQKQCLLSKRSIFRKEKCSQSENFAPKKFLFYTIGYMLYKKKKFRSKILIQEKSLLPK